MKMNCFCTLSDYGYLNKGLTLYDSLISSQDEFTLNYLCLDQKSFEKLLELDLPNIKAFSLQEILERDRVLLAAKERLTYQNFCFALSSYFSLYLLNQGNENVLYMDSDLFFYNNVSIIEREIGEKSIGIIRHRHVKKGHFVGEYNVGIVYFKNDDIGKLCCDSWWSWVSNPSNPYAAEYGTCGDQKYLELFEPIFGEENICVIENESSHIAPFNFHLVDFSIFNESDRKLIYKGMEHKVTFCHFMKFRPDFQNDRYEPTDEPDNQKWINTPQVKFLYDEYYRKTKLSKEKYQL